MIINAAEIRLKRWHVFWQELRGLAATVVLPADDRAEPSCGDTNVHVALFSRGDAGGSTLLAVNGAATKATVQLWEQGGGSALIKLELPAWGVASADLAHGTGLQCHS